MFLSEKEIDEVLACPNCNEKLEEGKFLPCGESVCAKCIDKIIEDNEKRREGDIIMGEFLFFSLRLLRA